MHHIGLSGLIAATFSIDHPCSRQRFAPPGAGHPLRGPSVTNRAQGLDVGAIVPGAAGVLVDDRARGDAAHHGRCRRRREHPVVNSPARGAPLAAAELELKAT